MTEMLPSISSIYHDLQWNDVELEPLSSFEKLLDVQLVQMETTEFQEIEASVSKCTGVPDSDVLSDPLFEMKEQKIESKVKDEQKEVLSLLSEFVDDIDCQEGSRNASRWFRGENFFMLKVDDILAMNPMELWTADCQYGLELHSWLSRRKNLLQPSNPSRKVQAKIFIHIFCLDLLLHPKFERLVRWVSQETLKFKILNTKEVARLWKVIKGNQVKNFDTFGRGIRFSMARGFFKRIVPSEKRVYMLTNKALDSYYEMRRINPRAFLRPN